jgi:hypothetical protein
MKKIKKESEETPNTSNQRYTAFQLRVSSSTFYNFQALQRAKMDVPSNSSSNLPQNTRQFSDMASQDLVAEFHESCKMDDDNGELSMADVRVP